MNARRLLWASIAAANEGSGSAPAILRPTRSDPAATLADADGGGAIAPVGDVWAGLTVEAYVSAGDTVGAVRMRNGPGAPAVGSIVGLPATQRRAGFVPTDADYAQLTLSSPTVAATAIFRTFVPNGSNRIILTRDNASPSRLALMIDTVTTPGRLRVQWFEGGSARINAGTSFDAWDFAKRYWLCGTWESDGVSCTATAYVYDADGTFITSATGTFLAPLALAGVYRIGRNVSTGNAWGEKVVEGYVWDGAALSSSQVANVVAARAAGTLTVDEIKTVHGADLATDGAVSGIVDPLDATLLAYQSAGTPGQITAEPAP